MDLLSNLIQNTSKPKLMAVTCLASFIAPYAISGAKTIILNTFTKQK